MIDIVAATQLSMDDFCIKSPLGLSLMRMGFAEERFRAYIAPLNHVGLPQLYNSRIAASDAGDILTFIHDDVWLDDYFFCDRIEDALKVYDVVGVAGNRRRQPYQAEWSCTPYRNPEEAQYRSGTVAHGEKPFGIVHSYGSCPVACELLDGVLLAARTESLRSKSVFFDELFQFHFYDMDFSRTANEKGLNVGTWPIAITHASEGDYYTPDWQKARDTYFRKWGQ